VDIDFQSWTQLAIRWLHFTAGVAWIGASFYFVWLDNSLRNNGRLRSGVAGDLWAVHGGGFYHNEKFVVAPARLPEHLHWFKWEAYTTFLSGFALLILIYYLQADVYLIDRGKVDFSEGGAVAAGLVCLAGGWIVYDLLCRSPLKNNQTLFGVALFLLLTAACYGLTRLFSDRAALIHAGALIGAIMAANVFFVIIPNQKKAVAAMIAGATPDAALGRAAKERSVHNNYLTLPALLTMISGHYPLLTGHAFNWLLLAGFSAASVAARHYFNLRHKGEEWPALLGVGATLFLGTILLASLTGPRAAGAPSAVADDELVTTLMSRHCVSCHAERPTHESFAAAPAGLSLETLADVRLHADQIRLQAVEQALMPLGNETQMTAEERALLGAWLDAGESAR
jgi:uncharacterized membrane protein